MARLSFCTAPLTSILVLTPRGYAANWGVEFTGTSWKMDAKDFRTSDDSLMNFASSGGNSSSYKITQGTLGGQAAVFLEGKSPLRFGVSLGYGVMPDVMDDDGHGDWIDLGGSKPFKYDYSGLRANLALRVYFS